MQKELSMANIPKVYEASKAVNNRFDSRQQTEIDKEQFLWEHVFLKNKWKKHNAGSKLVNAKPVCLTDDELSRLSLS